MRGGTITAISGTTLTLRTENGTETVDTSTSTTYSKELRTISFSDLQVGDVVAVAATPPAASSAKTSTPPVPGTGTVKATAVTVVEPSFTGRVASIGSGTYTLVGGDGQLLTVTTSGGTRYYKGATQASASAVSVGSHVMVEGTQSSLTDLAADLVVVGPPPGDGPAPGAVHPGAPAPPTQPTKATSGSTTSGSTRASSSGS